ncbi:MAG: proline--tRNA ligase, partial [Campylobacter hyointestinalis]
MKFTKLYIPTTKEAPKDATLPSHQFLIRAGFVAQIGSGLYNFLPLGKRVLRKVENIVRDEMDKAGANEVALSFVVPGELWKQSRRYFKFGKELLRLKDRKDNEFLLAPTHEESIVDLVRDKVTSYKQLPLHLYQIGLKFRDEARPRFGLLRCREFIMKDGYSFHANEADLKREFDLMEKTYTKIFSRLGLNFRAVEADSGAIGGRGS